MSSSRDDSSRDTPLACFHRTNTVPPAQMLLEFLWGMAFGNVYTGIQSEVTKALLLCYSFFLKKINKRNHACIFVVWLHISVTKRFARFIPNDHPQAIFDSLPKFKQPSESADLATSKQIVPLHQRKQVRIWRWHSLANTPPRPPPQKWTSKNTLNKDRIFGRSVQPLEETFWQGNTDLRGLSLKSWTEKKREQFS